MEQSELKTYLKCCHLLVETEHIMKDYQAIYERNDKVTREQEEALLETED